MRACETCGASLEGRDRRARTCSASCRREASRIRRLSAGLPEHGYTTIADYLARARKCVQNAEGRSNVRAVNTARAATGGTAPPAWAHGVLVREPHRKLHADNHVSTAATAARLPATRDRSSGVRPKGAVA